jgi:hypothetical protein
MVGDGAGVSLGRQLAGASPAEVKLLESTLARIHWHKPLIGHLQHHLRDPNREMAHGRIYRLTYEGMPLCAVV